MGYLSAHLTLGSRLCLNDVSLLVLELLYIYQGAWLYWAVILRFPPLHTPQTRSNGYIVLYHGCAYTLVMFRCKNVGVI